MTEIFSTQQTVILSDWHLGQFYCRHGVLSRYMQNLQCGRLIVNGDGIDLIEMQQSTLPPRGRNFVVELENRAHKILPPAHFAVLRRMRQMAESGVTVDWVVGNHDAEFKNHFGQKFFGATLVDSLMFQTTQNKTVLVVHGDQFDSRPKKLSLWHKILDLGYFANLRLDIAQNGLRQALGFYPFSIPKFVRRTLGLCQGQLDDFRARMTQHAVDKKADIIVCGHIHEPEDAISGSVRRINTGDFTESYTGAAIDRDGNIRVFELPLFVPRSFRRRTDDIPVRILHPKTCQQWLKQQVAGSVRTY